MARGLPHDTLFTGSLSVHLNLRSPLRPRHSPFLARHALLGLDDVARGARVLFAHRALPGRGCDTPRLGDLEHALEKQRDRFPALWPVDEGGTSVVGELYDVPLDTLRDRFIPAEPEELELSVIELADGSSAVAVVLRREYLNSPELTDISERDGWRAYRSGLTQTQ